MPSESASLEIVIVLVIVLVIFGPKRLPDLGRSLGSGMREFKDSVTGKDDDKKLTAGDRDQDRSPRERRPSHAEVASRPPGSTR